MFEFIEHATNFIGTVFVYIYNTILQNKILMSFFFLPVIITCVLLIIDFIFDIRDNFTDFNKFKDKFYGTYKLFYSKHKKQNKLDMNEVYQRSKENADYKHNLKMEELKYFRQNENLRHTHKVEESNLFSNRHSIPKHNDRKKVNLDIEYEED